MLITETADEIIACGRELYRRVQQLGWPEGGISALRGLSSRLWTETEVCARVRDEGMPVTAGRLAAAREAQVNLIRAVHAYCGDDAAAFASGQDGSAAA